VSMHRPAQRHRPAASQTFAARIMYPAFVPTRTRVQDAATDAAAAADKAAADAAALAAAAAGGWKPPASQVELDQMIENRLARERAAARRELDRVKAEAAGQSPEDLRELEALRRDKSERERKALEEKGNYDRAVDSIRKEHEAEVKKVGEERAALLKELHQTRCHDALLSGASSANAVNPVQVARLLAENVKLNDDRRVVVLDDEGNPWLKGGKNISIADLIEKFAHDNPHLFKAASQGQGSGAKGGSSTADEGGDGLDAQIVEAEAAYKTAHDAALVSGAMPDVDASRQALRKLTALKAEKKKKGAAV
jgi:hypothetical protein